MTKLKWDEEYEEYQDFLRGRVTHRQMAKRIADRKGGKPSIGRVYQWVTRLTRKLFAQGLLKIGRKN